MQLFQSSFLKDFICFSESHDATWSDIVILGCFCDYKWVIYYLFLSVTL